MTTNDSSTPKKAENAQVQAVRKEFTLTGSEQNLDPAALGSQSPLELLAEVQEVAQSIARTRRDWEGSLLERRLSALEFALRAQAEAVLRVGQAARELMERSEQPEHTCNWSYGRGAKEALEDIRAAPRSGRHCWRCPVTLVTRTIEHLAGDLRQVQELVQRKPGRPANYYAVKLNLSHAYTRRLLVQLEQLGELDSKRVRVYRVAVRP